MASTKMKRSYIIGQSVTSRTVYLLSALLAWYSGSSNHSTAPQQGTADSAKIIKTNTQNTITNQQVQVQTIPPKSDSQAAGLQKNDNRITGQVKFIPATDTEVVDGDIIRVNLNGREAKIQVYRRPHSRDRPSRIQELKSSFR